MDQQSDLKSRVYAIKNDDSTLKRSKKGNQQLLCRELEAGKQLVVYPVLFLLYTAISFAWLSLI